MIFWDTSALLKLYVAEPDSNIFLMLMRDGEMVAVSAWTMHELLCGLHRKELLHSLRAGGAEAIYKRFLQQIAAGALHVIAYTDVVAQRASDVIRGCYGARRPVAIRSLDALQLGSALASGVTELVSSDTRTRAGAKIFNLRVSPTEK